MSGDELLQLGFAAAVTLALIGISALLGAWRSVKVDEASARDRLAFDEPDFRIDALMIGTDGKSAIALDSAKGEGALVFALGDGLATRRFKIGAVEAAVEGAMLNFKLRDASKWQVRVAASAAEVAAAWSQRIAPSESRSDSPKPATRTPPLGEAEGGQGGSGAASPSRHS